MKTENPDIELVKSVFEAIQTSENLDGAKQLINHIEKKYLFNPDTYPELQFELNTEDVSQIIIKTEQRNSKGSKKYIKEFPTDQLNGLGKLLYALVWKQGDLNKLIPIIEGINSKDGDEEQENAIVFRQFGRHLNNREGEPIVDQHVIRAFAVFKSIGNSYEILKYRKLSIIGKGEKDMITKYKKWLSEEVNPNIRAQANYRSEIDKILFALGKYIKIKKKVPNMSQE